MKKRIISTSIALLGAITMMAQGIQKAMPIYSDEPITEAPAGKVFNNCQRSGYSYYYSNGDVFGGYNDGFVGEYIMGDDGCIYIKEACASLNAGTYLKLDKIDDENYVCHTAQLVWVYDSGDKVYTYFATRLVMHKYSDTSYGYIVETDDNGKELCDIYFTYKDGVLMQTDQSVIDMNGQILPHEMIGLTNSTGGWIGFGDACLIFTSTGFNLNVLPRNAKVMEGSFTYSTMSSITGKNIRNSQLTKYAEVGDDFYLLNPVDGKNWIKGQIDRTAGTVTFLPQYVGINESIGCHQWLAPASYKDTFEMWDEEDGTGTWYRDFTATDKYVCRYENGNVISDPESMQTMVLSLSDQVIQASGAYSLINILPYEHKLSKPSKPALLRFTPVEETFFWGEIVFAISPVDENGSYINTEELYYCIYLNSTEPFKFTTDEFGKIPEDWTDIPYLYDDDYEFDCNGAFHNIYFYTEGIKSLGIQAIHKMDGQEMRSEIEWWGEVPADITKTTSESQTILVKKLENGRIVIVKDGISYNLNGQIVQ